MASTVKKRSRRGVTKSTDVSPEPTTSDHKILWGLAAGRCSWCRDKLTLERESHPKVTLGEMCHIVGEKASAARGSESLPMTERGKYTNLILLCRNHHVIVDRHATKYTVPVLHKMKDDHERWVEDRLATTLDVGDMVYADVIDLITQRLPLERWRGFVDNALRTIVRHELIDVRGELNEKLLSTLWPGKAPDFELAVNELITAFDEWITLFEANAYLANPDDPFLRRDRSYKRGSYEQISQGDAYEDEWEKACYLLLVRFVQKLNNYADKVRATINPMYFRRTGKFLMFDDMGVWHGMRPVIFEASEVDLPPKFARCLKRARRRLLE